MNPAIESIYNRLANFLVINIDFSGMSVILEAGCGSGNLTVPFAKSVMKILKEFRIIALDVAAGPYKGTLDILRERVRKENLEEFIEIVEGLAPRK